VMRNQQSQVACYIFDSLGSNEGCVEHNGADDRGNTCCPAIGGLPSGVVRASPEGPPMMYSLASSAITPNCCVHVLIYRSHCKIHGRHD